MKSPTVKAGHTWHPENDNLKGTAKYGTFQDDMEADATFSRKWKNKEFDQFLFATSGFEQWMIMTREAVGGEAISDGKIERLRISLLKLLDRTPAPVS